MVMSFYGKDTAFSKGIPSLYMKMWAEFSALELMGRFGLEK